jgi:hypothetical protein
MYICNEEVKNRMEGTNVVIGSRLPFVQLKYQEPENKGCHAV